MLIRVMLCFLGKVEGVSRGIAVEDSQVIFYYLDKFFKNLAETDKTPLAPADFEIKVKRIAHSIVHFDQWNKLISTITFLKLVCSTDQNAL